MAPMAGTTTDIDPLMDWEKTSLGNSPSRTDPQGILHIFIENFMKCGKREYDLNENNKLPSP